MRVLTSEEWVQLLLDKPLNNQQQSYLSFYRLDMNALVLEPGLMQVPMDDHMVHRGDAVFEAFKTVEGKIYLLDAHLDRLFLSAEKIGLTVPLTKPELEKRIIEVLQETKRDMRDAVPDFLIRLFVSRGPGGMTTNPYECQGPGLYILVQRFLPPPASLRQQGARIGKSQWEPKAYPWAQIKSCNYLPNVMVKKEAIDRGLDFLISLRTPDGLVTESSTENLALINKGGKLVLPPYKAILKGTTLHRLRELVDSSNNKLSVKSSEENPYLTEADILSAELVFMIGTTLDIIPVSEYENQKICLNHKLYQELSSALADDQRNGPFLTAF